MTPAIQILGLRDYTDKKGLKKKATRFFNKNWRAENVPELIKNIDKYVAQIPEEERYNLYFTSAECIEADKPRLLEKQHIITYDIDHIDVERYESYIEPILDELVLNYEETLIIMTGHGLHFHVNMKNPITNDDFFQENRKYYNEICRLINVRLQSEGLPGEADPAMFSPARLARLPNTTNRKPNMPDCKAFVINATSKQIDYGLKEESEIQEIPREAYTADTILKNFRTPDTQAVLDGCAFIKWCGENQGKVKQEQWHILGSIVPRLHGIRKVDQLRKGRELFHKYSNKYPGYDPEETDIMIDRCMAPKTGPTSCENVNKCFDCTKCLNYGLVKHPIFIKGPEFMETQDSGFRNQPKNKATVGTVNQSDLAMFFSQQQPFLTEPRSTLVHTWEDNFWQEKEFLELKGFTQEHVNPPPAERDRTEFVKFIQASNHKKQTFFEDSIKGFINFKNGILNIQTGKLIPHSDSFGFTSILPYSYDPNAACPRFKKFLAEVMEDKEDLQTIILEFMGYGLVQEDPSFGEKALFLSGEGQNGKSVLMDVIERLAGEDNCSNVLMQQFENEQTRYLIRNKLFNISSESSSGSLHNSAYFKTIVTGEKLVVKKVFAPPFTIKPMAKLILSCNSLPTSKDQTKGLIRRLLIVPFKVSFEGKNKIPGPVLRASLYEELPGIFNLAVKAYKEMKKRGEFTFSDSSQEEIEDFKKMNNPLYEWVSESLEKTDPKSFMPTHELYIAYIQDIEKFNKFSAQISETSFRRSINRILAAKEYKGDRRTLKDKKLRGFLGIKFIEDRNI